MAHPLRMNIKETYCLQKLIKMHIDLYIFFVIVGGGVDSYLKLLLLVTCGYSSESEGNSLVYSAPCCIFSVVHSNTIIPKLNPASIFMALALVLLI